MSSFSLDQLNNNKLLMLIIFSILFGSTGLGINNLISDSITSTELQQFRDTTTEQILTHVSNGSPHLGTETKLDFIMQDMKTTKLDIKEVLEKVHKLTIIVCSNSEYNC